MRYLRFFLFLTLAMCLVLSICPAAFAATEGSCGYNATWHFEDGTLTISGTGLVTDISWHDFHNQIVKVVVEPGIISLPKSAFQDCEFLTDVTLPEGLIKLGNSAFMNCISLDTMQLPSTLTDIGQSVFQNSGLTGITIPDGVEHIRTSAFMGCTKLEEIRLPESLTTIADKAFANCFSLQSIVLPQNVTVISDYTFQGCHGLTSVTLSPQTTTIGFNAFAQCYAMRSITIPSSVQFIYGLPSTLEEVHISDLAAWCTANYAYENHCLENTGLYLNGELITDLVIPDGCTAISPYAFSNYNKLKSVTMPEGFTTIGNYAFQNCHSLQSVSLPYSLRHIGDSAFAHAVNLESVVYSGSINDLKKVEIYGGNDALLNGFLQVGTPDITTFSAYYYAFILALACLLQLGVLIACLVIFIRQKTYPFL